MPETDVAGIEPETQLASQSAPPSDSAMSIAISKAPVIARIFTSLILIAFTIHILELVNRDLATARAGPILLQQKRRRNH